MIYGLGEGASAENQVRLLEERWTQLVRAATARAPISLPPFGIHLSRTSKRGGVVQGIPLGKQVAVSTSVTDTVG